MATFADRLREEIEYIGISQKELAERAGIKKRALDMYVGYRESMPPADVAVRLAKVLHVSVEYLVTGFDEKREELNHYYKMMLSDLKKLNDAEIQTVGIMIHALAEKNSSSAQKSAR